MKDIVRGVRSVCQEGHMYKTILVPLDGSQRAEAILPHIESLAECLGSKIVIVNVVEPVVVPLTAEVVFSPADMEQQEEESRSYLHSVQARLLEKGLTAEARMMYGPVVEGIVLAAEEAGADLIAMASHGRSGLGHVFYGSVAAGVLHRVDRPLLVIRAGE